MDAPVKVACIQAEPVILDREATIDKLGALAAEAAGNGAQLLVFPEAFVPAYPSSVWAKALAGWSEPGATEAFALLARESVPVPGEAEARIGEAARANGVWIVTGVTEVDPARPSTLYNTLLYHAPDGTLALKHRKLVPTNHERLIWGQGDGEGLRAIPTPLGRIGGLICWENYMPLARFALYESGVEIYIASTADDGDAWQPTLVHIARESRSFVISPSHFQRATSYPDDFPLRRLIEGTGHDRPRRLGDPRAWWRLPCGPALRRGGHPLRRARSGRPLGRAAAVRCCGPLPPPRRARPPADPAREMSSAAVVGAGVFGASIARELDRRGWDVTLHEQYSPGNTRSGSGGDTRLLRFSHGDQEWYTLSAQRSLERWRELEAASGLTLFEPVGIAWFDTGASDFADQSQRTLERLGIACERLDPQEAKRLYPSLGGDDLRSVLFEPGAGILNARVATRATRRRPRPEAREADPRRTAERGRGRLGVRLRGCRSCSPASSSSGSPAATSSSSASTRAGTGHRASASTTARTTATATSTGWV